MTGLELNGLCIDTNAYANFRRGHPEVVGLIDGAHRIAVPAIVLGELHCGFRKGSRLAENLRLLTAFLREPVVDVLGVDTQTAEAYAELWLGLRKAGTPIPTNDLWIAALSLRHGLPLLTFDAHFEYVPQIGVIRLTTSDQL